MRVLIFKRAVALLWRLDPSNQELARAGNVLSHFGVHRVLGELEKSGEIQQHKRTYQINAKLLARFREAKEAVQK
jgi:CRP-like cAMP-binding protein